MPMDSLRELWMDELKDIYSAENQILKALPKMVKTASTPELKEAFKEHLEQTRGHVERLDQIFSAAGGSARGKKCKGMEGLLEEGKEVMEEDGAEPVIDAALIGAAQRVEHYEIAAYGTARTHAELLGEDEARELLDETLQEEKETDDRLTEISEQINMEADEPEHTKSKVASNGKRPRTSARKAAKR